MLKYSKSSITYPIFFHRHNSQLTFTLHIPVLYSVICAYVNIMGLKKAVIFVIMLFFHYTNFVFWVS